MELFAAIGSFVGIAMGAWGAYRLFTADQPKSDWILELFNLVGDKPSYGVIAPDTYHPAQEREAGHKRAKEVQHSMDQFARRARSGIGWVFAGFVVQGLTLLLSIISDVGGF